MGCKSPSPLRRRERERDKDKQKDKDLAQSKAFYCIQRDYGRRQQMRQQDRTCT